MSFDIDCQTTIVARASIGGKHRSVPRTKEIPLEMAGLPVRLAEAMKVRGVERGTQLAKMADVDQATVSRLVLTSGGRPIEPRADAPRLAGIQAQVVLRLANALDVHVGWLLAGDGQRDVTEVLAAGTKGVPDETLDELSLASEGADHPPRPNLRKRKVTNKRR